jgi:hypothetical protein
MTTWRDGFHYNTSLLHPQLWWRASLTDSLVLLNLFILCILIALNCSFTAPKSAPLIYTITVARPSYMFLFHHIIRFVIFWDITQRRVVIPYRRFETTSVPSSRVEKSKRKCRYGVTSIRCVTSQKSADLIYTAAEAWSHVVIYYTLVSFKSWSRSLWGWRKLCRSDFRENATKACHSLLSCNVTIK